MHPPGCADGRRTLALWVMITKRVGDSSPFRTRVTVDFFVRRKRPVDERVDKQVGRGVDE